MIGAQAITGHDVVLRWVLDRLQAAPALAERIEEEREEPMLRESESSAVFVALGSSRPANDQFGQPQDWETTIRTVLLVRQDEENAFTGYGASNLWVSVRRRLMDPKAFPGHVLGVVDGQVNPANDLADTRLTCLAVDFQVNHRTDYLTLEPIE